MQIRSQLLRVTSVILLVLCGGCATRNNQLQESKPLQGEAVGYIVASLAFRVVEDDSARAWIYSPSIAAHLDSLTDSSRVPITTYDKSVRGMWEQTQLIEDEGWRRRLLVLVEAKPGRYRLSKVYLTLFAYRERELIQEMSDTPTIEVKAGEVSYAGCIQLAFTTGKNVFGATLPDRASFTLLDEYAKDVAAAKRIDPRLSTKAVRNALRE